MSVVRAPTCNTATGRVGRARPPGVLCGLAPRRTVLEALQAQLCTAVLRAPLVQARIDQMLAPIRRSSSRGAAASLACSSSRRRLEFSRIARCPTRLRATGALAAHRRWATTASRTVYRRETRWDLQLPSPARSEAHEGASLAAAHTHTHDRQATIIRSHAPTRGTSLACRLRQAQCMGCLVRRGRQLCTWHGGGRGGGIHVCEARPRAHSEGISAVLLIKYSFDNEFLLLILNRRVEDSFCRSEADGPPRLRESLAP